MAEQQKQQHRHHHHKDAATMFKQRSLASIKHRRIFERVLKIIVSAIAIVMVILVVLAYTIG